MLYDIVDKGQFLEIRVIPGRDVWYRVISIQAVDVKFSDFEVWFINTDGKRVKCSLDNVRDIRIGIMPDKGEDFPLDGLTDIKFYGVLSEYPPVLPDVSIEDQESGATDQLSV